jgi:hypothetical protein
MTTSINNKFFICFTVDLDADCYFGNKLTKATAIDKSILGWKGFENGKNKITDITDAWVDSVGNRLPITWFVRCDRQIYDKYGDYAFLLKCYDKWWQQRIDAGDNIQWHAHLYRSENNQWVQETRKQNLFADLSAGKKAFESFGIRPAASRIGEAYQSDDLMLILDELGLRADCTAMPGRKRKDAEKNIDWESTPNHPYHPSKTDYRIPGADELKIWEIPMTTVQTQVSYDERSLLRYVNPAFHPEILSDGLADLIKRANFLVTIVHPFEVLSSFFCDDTLNSHPLIAFEPEALQKNLHNLTSILKKAKRDFRFVTVEQLVNLLDNYVERD